MFERRISPPRLSVLEPGRQATRRRRRLPLVVLPLALAITAAGAAIVLLAAL
ncbi:hypothetical protein DVA67_008450 [Solirubrobacter sp. CPCC 204708]|uniref:Uncharacterized protein n=1 Tax=Solirubrobacter deserti TaxID=2282478 RepID=A0ABT4RDZ6_9ACTN|nr:hypothetical protein [Solirubrobacter deserti]MBE2316002.1 hypothetical protein [Solirubrobacter deserti]MDA0136754.1 hypothetical protein [Solirubrobacter deserti]